MTRRVSIHHEWTRPYEILTYDRRSLLALELLWREVSRGTRAIPDSVVVHPTQRESDGVMSEMRDELDREVTMALLASFEALFRTDFLDRVRGRLKDPASRDLRALHRGKGDRPDMDSILDVWKSHSSRPQRISRLKQYFDRRHWLAHGRYYVHKSGRQPSPQDVREVGRQVLEDLPNFPRLRP